MVLKAAFYIRTPMYRGEAGKTYGIPKLKRNFLFTKNLFYHEKNISFLNRSDEIMIMRLRIGHTDTILP